MWGDAGILAGFLPVLRFDVSGFMPIMYWDMFLEVSSKVWQGKIAFYGRLNAQSN